MYAAKVLADSVSPCGVRLTTLQVTFPRIVLAEFNTHRMLSRNSASSRAIPVEKRIAEVEADPFVPVEKRIAEVEADPFVPEAFGMNRPGMQAGAAVDPAMQAMSRAAWREACRRAVDGARTLVEAGVHKQWANRLLEPFAWHTVIVTATEWENFFALRCNEMAQPEIRRAAEMMRDAMAASAPRKMGIGEWHLPLFGYDEDGLTFNDNDPGALPMSEAIKVSVARCARVSYLTHDGRRDVDADLALYDRLLSSGHMSPFEHVAYVGQLVNCDGFCDDTELALWKVGPQWVGNFRWPWVQFRKTLPGESVWSGGSGK
jgi:thymidylate synthase ThyX